MSIGIGEVLALASAAAWAVGVILARQLGTTLPPLALNLLKNSGIFLLLTPVVLVLYAGQWPSMPMRDVMWVMISGLLGIALADTLYFRALNQLGAGHMGVIGNLYSPLVLVMSLLWLDERLSPRQWLGFALVGLGVLLVSHPTPASPVPATHRVRSILTGIAAIALMAIAIVMIKPILERTPLLWVTQLRLLGALAGLLLLAALPGMRRHRQFDASKVPWYRLILAALIGQGLSMVFWLGGYKYTSASVAAILNESASVFLLLLAALWLREPLGRRGITGVLLTFSGIICMLLGRTTP